MLPALIPLQEYDDRADRAPTPGLARPAELRPESGAMSLAALLPGVTRAARQGTGGTSPLRGHPRPGISMAQPREHGVIGGQFLLKPRLELLQVARVSLFAIRGIPILSGSCGARIREPAAQHQQ